MVTMPPTTPNSAAAAPDFLTDVINRLAAAIAATQADTDERLAALERVEQGLRLDYGHDRVSIRLGNEARNAAIIRDYLNGEHFALLQRRYSLSKRAIIYIIKGRPTAAAGAQNR